MKLLYSLSSLVALASTASALNNNCHQQQAALAQGYTECLSTCNPGQAKDAPAPCHSHADLIWLLDSSTSVGQANYTKALNFIRDLSLSFDIGPHKSRVALMKYSNKNYQDLEFNLKSKANTDKTSMAKALYGVSYKRGNTYTGRALQMIRKAVVHDAHAEDPYRPKVLIAVTDGAAQDWNYIPAAITALKKYNMNILAIGIGKAKRSELEEIAWNGNYATKHENVYYAKSFDAISKIKRQIGSKLCSASKDLTDLNSRLNSAMGRKILKSQVKFLANEFNEKEIPIPGDDDDDVVATKPSTDDYYDDEDYYYEDDGHGLPK